MSKQNRTDEEKEAAEKKEVSKPDWASMALSSVAGALAAGAAYWLLSDDNSKLKSRFRSDFNVIRTIGEGAFGKVYEAKKKLTGMIYAVKQIMVKRSAIVNPLTEVRALEGLDHENIVRYFDAWVEAEEPQYDIFIQMQFCCNGNLEDWLETTDMQRRDGRSELIWNQIAAAVQYIHGKGLIHRDLKPQNIFFETEDKIRIGDFGLVTERQESMTIAGTPLYMAPEMFRECGYNYKVDVYSAGMILFELLNFFSAEAERKAVLRNVKNSRYPPEFVKAHPEEVSYEAVTSYRY